MGIAGFTEWFLKTFPKTVTKVGSGNVPADHVFIDFNQFVHKVSRSSRSYNILWKKMYKELDTILNITNPRQSVYIVMDGPGTKAKKEQKRRRRKRLFLCLQYFQMAAISEFKMTCLLIHKCSCLTCCDGGPQHRAQN